MQPGITHTRQAELLGAAKWIERNAGVAAVLRESRLEVWEERIEGDWEMYSQIMDEDAARFYAEEDVTRVRLTIPADNAAWICITEDDGVTLEALRTQIPDLEDFELVGAHEGELPTQSGSVVRCYNWRGLWLRSGSELQIAKALDRANVVVAPNASVRLGITPDHREPREPDFLVIADGKAGVLEVDGAPWHPPERADQHHERDRRFQEHGIMVQRFSSDRCAEMPDDVVADFLRLLARS